MCHSHLGSLLETVNLSKTFSDGRCVMSRSTGIRTERLPKVKRCFLVFALGSFLGGRNLFREMLLVTQAFLRLLFWVTYGLLRFILNKLGKWVTTEVNALVYVWYFCVFKSTLIFFKHLYPRCVQHGCCTFSIRVSFRSNDCSLYFR